MTDFSYVVTHDPGPSNNPVDITDFVERIEINEVGTGEVRNAHLRLNAQQGQFITQANGGDTPILDEFQRIEIKITDRDGVDFDAVYEVDNLKPIQNTQQGTVLEVELLGLEHHLQKVMFAKQFFFESGFEVTRDIIDFYNSPDSKGPLQPVVAEQDDVYGAVSADAGNDMPKFTANQYTFEISELTTYDALINVVDRLGSSVAAGGAGDFFELNFFNDFSDPTLNTILFRAFSSGNPPDQVVIPTIIDTNSVNPGEEEGGIESTMGTVVGTWGSDGIGTLPTNNSDFQGKLEAWPLFPESDASVTYPEDSIFLVAGTTDAEDDEFHYIAIVDNAGTPFPIPPSSGNSEWSQLLFSAFLLPTTLYSLWTSTLSDEWKGCGANVDGIEAQSPVQFTSPACWDSNLVIIDGERFRTWVDIRAVDLSAIPVQYKKGGTFYRGFRILVDTNLGAPVAPLDDASFADNVVKFDGFNFNLFREMSDNNQCGVDDEAKVYELQTGSWTDISSALDEANDCYHPIFATGQDQGPINKPVLFTNYGFSSAVTFEYRYRDDDINGLLASASHYGVGAWLNFRSPFPANSFFSTSIGTLYGGGVTSSREPATFDSNNMHLSPSGFVGFNNVEAENLGPLDALTFNIKINWSFQLDGSGGFVPHGNYAFRCTMYDTSDNVVVQDFVVPVTGLWQQISLPVGNFNIYRARAPIAFSNTGQIIFLQGLEVLQVFEYKNIQKIAIQWQGSYDEEGRYNPIASTGFLAQWLIGQIVPFQLLDFLITGYNVKLSIDSFEWSKVGLSMSTPNTTDRALMPKFLQNPFITNKFQLDQANLAQLEIFNFRHRQYEVVTEGLNDLRFGDSFFLENDTLVNLSDDGPNTIKLVVKRLKLEIDKVPSGPGGFLRTLTGVKRFT